MKTTFTLSLLSVGLASGLAADYAVRSHGALQTKLAISGCPSNWPAQIRLLSTNALTVEYPGNLGWTLETDATLNAIRARDGVDWTNFLSWFGHTAAEQVILLVDLRDRINQGNWDADLRVDFLQNDLLSIIVKVLTNNPALLTSLTAQQKARATNAVANLAVFQAHRAAAATNLALIFSDPNFDPLTATNWPSGTIGE